MVLLFTTITLTDWGHRNFVDALDMFPDVHNTPEQRIASTMKQVQSFLYLK